MKPTPAYQDSYSGKVSYVRSVTEHPSSGSSKLSTTISLRGAWDAGIPTLLTTLYCNISLNKLIFSFRFYVIQWLSKFGLRASARVTRRFTILSLRKRGMSSYSFPSCFSRWAGYISRTIDLCCDMRWNSNKNKSIGSYF